MVNKETKAYHVKIAKTNRFTLCSRNKSVHAKEKKNARLIRKNRGQLTLLSRRVGEVLVMPRFPTSQWQEGTIIFKLQPDKLFLDTNLFLHIIRVVKFQDLAR